MGFTITTVNPLDHADEIKQLFVAHGRPEFPGFFARAYEPAVRAGGVSWLGRDDAGQVVMHVGCFPRRFRFGTRDVVGGLLVNALVAESYRSFFPARALMRRARGDIEARGDIDFLYTDPNDQARAVLEVSGFRRIGTLARLVLPVGDRRWLVDGAIRLLHARARLPRRVRAGPDPTPCRAAEHSAAAFEAPWGDSPRLRPHYGSALFAARLEGYPGPRDTWFTFSQNGGGSAPTAGLLVRGPDPSGVATLHAIRREPELSLGYVIPGLVRTLRAAGCTRLQIVTVAESELAAELRRAGFLARRDAASVIAAPLTPAGEAVLGAVRQWEITDLDCDR
ncbi:MAG: hypothetical protein DMD44_15250 [Gemmatimonadetes bacterium]|nr:MAG: hypothetical protein DMD44_15250 [Gemmatimonadota bacterium]